MRTSTEMLRSSNKFAKYESQVDCDIDGSDCQRQTFLPSGGTRELEGTLVNPSSTQVTAASLTAIVLGSILVLCGITSIIVLIILQKRKKSLLNEKPIKSRSMCVEEGIEKDEKNVNSSHSLETLPAPITPPNDGNNKKTKDKSNETKKTNKSKNNKLSPENIKLDKTTPYKDINFSPGQTGSGTKLFTAFTESAFFGQLDKLETFADLRGTTIDGAFARLPSNRASAQALSEHMTELDGEGYAALHRAIQGGSIKVIRWLLKNKANPRLLSRSGETPLHIAVLHQNIQACEILLATEASKDIHTKDFRHGHTPLDIAKACEIGNIVELLKVASEML